MAAAEAVAVVVASDGVDDNDHEGKRGVGRGLEDIDVDDDGNDGNRNCRDRMPCKRKPIKVRTKRLRG
jgi:hypothetical protein